jgi:hypothetical protein
MEVYFSEISNNELKKKIHNDQQNWEIMYKNVERDILF